MVKKLKELRVNSTPGSKFGTDPLNPWSTKSDITEASEQELLHRYLKSRGINPQFVSKQTKIAHSKSGAYLSWRKNHEFDESVTTQPSPFEIKRKELRKSVQAHKVLPSDVSSDGMHTEAKTIQGTALDKFRQAAAEREKKHYELQQKQSKDGSGMSAAIDRLQKHLNRENALDSQAATEAPVGPGEISADQPSMYRKKELSKSARMIKALYKKKGMSEEMYDWEKDDKAQSYGKKPKISKPEEDGKKSDGDDARIVVSGGKTLTGEPRDTIEVDPFMKKPKTNAPDDFEKPTSKKDH